MFIVYSNFEEAIVCVDTTENETIKTYFNEGERDLEDYNREELKDEAVLITFNVSIN